ncbi:hypothetical protein NADFUDRAFT_79413 [Nadsonia fulvescens var. elongata DSM 6958]|uniref:LDB19 N-terminal domain-containing protein n=1 Tax=Nadsonia fulvescens var. elongata DSM 6958 TaxID=857566 RepID=A0A1E3PGR9_9ASCO|nr:hypothetical protein NADFUDRAFT_79413 [Nadsonia fulvescens var. elongata DSM 6958]
MAPSPQVLAALGASSSNNVHSPRLEGIAHYHGHGHGHDRSPSHFLHLSPHNQHQAPSVEPPVKLSFKIESPPLLMYGLAKDSTGSLLNGLFTLEVLNVPSIAMKSVHMAIVQVVKYKRPVVATCKNCSSRTSELARWDVLDHFSSLVVKEHVYPFSHLLPGSIPATCDSGLFTISYRLEAYAYPDPSSGFTTPFILKQNLNVGRSIIRAVDRNSIRVFPPTDLKCNITLPAVVYPKSSFSIGMSLHGVVSAERGTRWRMRKMNWRIDETIKAKLYACQNHFSKLTPVPGNKLQEGPQTSYKHNSGTQNNRTENSDIVGSNTTQAESAVASTAPATSPTTAAATATSTSASAPAAISTTATSTSTPVPQQTGRPDRPVENKPEENTVEEVRAVGNGELRTGWKSDFSADGKIELFGDISTHNFSNVSCNLDDPQLAISIGHVLVVELVVAEETVASKNKSTPVPTGSARVLRMQFNLMVTQRSGLGIAWDDEVPPVYEDIPLSPPDYDIVGELPKFEEIVNLAMGPPGVGTNASSLMGINSQPLFSPLMPSTPMSVTPGSLTPANTTPTNTTPVSTTPVSGSATNLSGLVPLTSSRSTRSSQASLDSILTPSSGSTLFSTRL